MPLPTPAQTFDRIERAHAAWKRGAATIAVANVTSQGTSRARFRLDLDGTGGVTLRLQVPPQGANDATDQTYRLKDGTLTAVDARNGETLSRPAPSAGPLGLRLINALGGVDESIAFLLTSAGRERYLKPMRALGGWKTIAHGLERRTSTAGKSSLTRLDLDGTGRLTGLHLAFPGSRLDWTIAYGPAQLFAVARGLKRVENFTVRPRPPHYADPKAKAVVEGMLRAGGGLTSAIVRIDGAATLWVGGRRVRYEDGGTGFAYDGQSLTIVTPGAAYQGASKRSAVIDLVAQTLGKVDPLARSILVRTPPYLALFPSDARVRVVGTMASAGQPCDVVAVDAPRFRASLFVSKITHLPLSIETEALGATGSSLSRTTRTLSWSSVDSPLPNALFSLRLRVGQRVLPLPAVTRTALPTAP